MNRLFFLLAPVLMLLFETPLAGTEKRPARPGSFATFWAGFKSAVAKNDKEAVLAATDLQSFGLSKAAFFQANSSIFTRQVKKCFATAKPVKAEGLDSYSVFCGEEYYYFRKVNG